MPRNPKPSPGLGALTKAAQAAEQQYREQCRRSLRDGVCFDDLDELVNRLNESRRERWARNTEQRAYFRALDRADIWLALATGVTAERGRASEWSEDAAEALDGVAAAVRRLVAVFGCHPSFRLDAAATVGMGFGALRTVLEKRWFTDVEALQAFALIRPEDLAAAFQRLRAAFHTTRPGRPRATWRSDIVTLLKDTGVSHLDAVELADAAGLTAGARRVERRGRSARQKQRARRRRSEKLPSK